MRLLFAFYILFSVVLDSCHAIAEVNSAQSTIEAQENSQAQILSSHNDCGESHPSSDEQTHHCHFTHCTFLIEPQIRMALAADTRLQTDYFFIEPQSSTRHLRRPPKA